MTYKSISRIAMLFMILFLFVVINGCATKSVLIVDKTGNGDYTSIRSAVSDWQHGQKLIIRPGVYDEQLILKTWMKIDGKEGIPAEQAGSIDEDKNKVVLAFSGDGPTVVGRDVSEVKLSNLVIRKDKEDKKPVVQLVGTDIEIDNCSISNSKTAGIEAARFGNLVLKNSRVENNDYAGIFLHHQARAEIQSNVINANRRGIAIVRHPDGIPKNRTIYRDEEEDIEVLIKENSITDNSFAGVYLTSGATADIISNSFVANAQDAILGEGKDRTINLDMGGIVITNESRARMMSNSISFSDMGIIFQEGTNGQALENTLTGNENYAIVVTGYGQPEIVGNTIKDNNGTGIMLRTSTEAIIQDNQIIKNKMQGIEIADTARPTIEGNWFIQNGESAIYSYNHAKPLIKQNIIVDNGIGIFVAKDSKVEIFNNTLFKNEKVGVWFTLRSVGTFANNVIMGSQTAISVLKNSEYQPAFMNNCLWENEVEFKGFLERPASNFTSDPLFRDPFKLDFTPLADSPLIGEAKGKKVIIGAIDPTEKK